MTVISRAQWGARHADGAGPAPEPASEAYLHHSVTAAPARDIDAEIRAVRQLEGIGQARFGAGISYNRPAMPSGRIFEGVSWARRGSHTRGRNSIARSWVLVGNHDQDPVTAEQIEAIAHDLVRAWRGGHLLYPQLSGGHRDAPGASTTCPGRHGMASIPKINARAAELARPTTTTTTPTALTLPEDTDMWVISAPGRGVAVVAPGYFAQLTNDEAVGAAVGLVGADRVRNGNDRQFDLWRAVCAQGTSHASELRPEIDRIPQETAAETLHALRDAIGGTG